jgi:hypothetical protein
MRISPLVVVLLALAAACGGDADAGPAPGDYFAQLQRVSETAHIQERGLRRDLRRGLEEPGPGESPRTVLMVFVDQSAALYGDVVDALEKLHPPDELVGAQGFYLEAWRGQLELSVKVRDASFPTADAILQQLELPAFRHARAETAAACEALQAAVAAAGSDVDLVCDGRPV